jgi:hypothetical protein
MDEATELAQLREVSSSSITKPCIRKGDSSHGRSSSATNMPMRRSGAATISFNSPSLNGLKPVFTA